MLAHMLVGELITGSVFSWWCHTAYQPIFTWFNLESSMTQCRHGRDKESDSREMVAYMATDSWTPQPTAETYWRWQLLQLAATTLLFPAFVVLYANAVSAADKSTTAVLAVSRPQAYTSSLLSRAANHDWSYVWSMVIAERSQSNADRGKPSCVHQWVTQKLLCNEHLVNNYELEWINIQTVLKKNDTNVQ